MERQLFQLKNYQRTAIDSERPPVEHHDEVQNMRLVS